MKNNVIFAVVVVVFAFVPVFMAQQVGTMAPMAKVESSSAGVYKYSGDTKGEVTFDHNAHVEALDQDCSSCHKDGAAITIASMSDGHGLCGECHEQTSDMKQCSSCHSK